MKRIWKDYFSFSKKERTAIILLLVLMAVFITLPYFFSLKGEMPMMSAELKQFLADSGEAVSKNTDSPDKVPESESKKTHLFFFDPNTISAEGWMALGIPGKTAATIIRYREKGGHFRAPDDLRRIWGIAKAQADQLIPYIRIPVSAPGFPPSSLSRLSTPKRNTPIDINTAPAGEWKQLPGIGDVLAARIVAYRERTGGFANPGQVKKIYGISDSIFASFSAFLRVDTNTVKKLDLNTVSQYVLMERTGISREAARAIIVSRQQYGPYKTVNDLKRIVFINDSLFSLIRPFVTVL